MGVKAAHWWRSLGDSFDKVDREMIRDAQQAEVRDTGHECGHEFAVTVTSRLHTSGVGEHTDADWTGDPNVVTVRAHNLRDALLVAATLPLGEWLDACCCCEVSPPEFGGPIPDRDCPEHGLPSSKEHE